MIQFQFIKKHSRFTHRDQPPILRVRALMLCSLSWSIHGNKTGHGMTRIQRRPLKLLLQPNKTKQTNTNMPSSLIARIEWTVFCHSVEVGINEFTPKFHFCHYLLMLTSFQMGKCRRQEHKMSFVLEILITEHQKLRRLDIIVFIAIYLALIFSCCFFFSLYLFLFLVIW